MKNNNINEQIIHLRDTFLEAEGSYATKIQEKRKRHIQQLSNVPNDSLYRIVRQFIDEVEYGDTLTEADMNHIEDEIITLLSAVNENDNNLKLTRHM